MLKKNMISELLCFGQYHVRLVYQFMASTFKFEEGTWLPRQRTSMTSIETICILVMLITISVWRLTLVESRTGLQLTINGIRCRHIGNLSFFKCSCVQSQTICQRYYKLSSTETLIKYYSVGNSGIDRTETGRCQRPLFLS